MAFTSPKMSLRIWDRLNDDFDHDQLADNWSKVDQHDHTPGRGVQVPTEGIYDGAITYAKISRGSLQTTTAAIPTTTAGNVATVTVNWPTAFADANYQAYGTVNGAAGSLVRVNVVSKTAASAVIEVRNDGAGSLTGATLQAFGVHS
jgi:hypothetical protein